MLQELLQNVLNRERTCDLAINSRTLYRLSYKNLETPFAPRAVTSLLIPMSGLEPESET